jgi:hypothetical protein
MQQVQRRDVERGRYPYPCPLAGESPGEVEPRLAVVETAVDVRARRRIAKRAASPRSPSSAARSSSVRARVADTAASCHAIGVGV